MRFAVPVVVSGAAFGGAFYAAGDHYVFGQGAIETSNQYVEACARSLGTVAIPTDKVPSACQDFAANMPRAESYDYGAEPTPAAVSLVKTVYNLPPRQVFLDHNLKAANEQNSQKTDWMKLVEPLGIIMGAAAGGLIAIQREGSRRRRASKVR